MNHLDLAFISFLGYIGDQTTIHEGGLDEENTSQVRKS